MSAYRAHIERVLGGNKNAFAQIVAMFKDMAMAVAVSRIGDHALAEDAVQEAFLAAFVKLPLLRDPEAFPGWFRTILVRHCDRARLRRDKAAVAWDDDAAQSVPDEGSEPYRLYTRHLDRALVRRILDVLPGLAREACIQRYVHGRPYEDIARLLAIPEGTVKRRLSEARRRIMAEFQTRRGRSVRLGYLPISDHLLAMVAHQMHDPSAYDLCLSRFLSWASLVRALRAELLDAAFVMAPLAMSLRNQGLPIRYVLDGHHDGSAVTVRRDRSGQGSGHGTMALPHAISTHSLLMREMLGTRDETDGRATRFISPSYVLASLNRREIDGFLCSEPWHTKSEAQGEGRILARSGEVAPGHICCVLVVREAFLLGQQELAQRFVAALQTAGEYIEAHPVESADIQSRYTGVDRDLAGHILSRRYVTFTDLAPDKGRAEQVMALALSAGVLDAPCDLDAFMASVAS